MSLLRKSVNALVYCKTFKIYYAGSDSLEYKMPESGRAYEAHVHSKTDELVVRVHSEDKIFSYIVEGNSGKNESFEYEFVEINGDNIESFDFHEEDLQMIEDFLNNKESDPIILKDGVVVEEETGVVPFTNTEEEFEENAETNEFIEKIMKAAQADTDRLHGSIKAMNTIISKDPVFAATIQDLVIYLANLYNVHTPVDLSHFAMSDYGKGFNVGQALYNLSSYMSTTHGDSLDNLNKAIQFILFEITRKSNSK